MKNWRRHEDLPEIMKKKRSDGRNRWSMIKMPAKVVKLGKEAKSQARMEAQREQAKHLPTINTYLSE